MSQCIGSVKPYGISDQGRAGRFLEKKGVENLFLENRIGTGSEEGGGVKKLEYIILL